MRRSLWVLVGIVIGVAGTSFLFAPSVTGARAGNFTSARASGFVWGDGAPTAPEGASDFCSSVYAGTGAEVSILMTLPDGAELVGAPIEDFFTIIETGDLISVRPCFDQDATNDPQGRVLSIEEAQAVLLSQPIDQPWLAIDEDPAAWATRQEEADRAWLANEILTSGTEPGPDTWMWNPCWPPDAMQWYPADFPEPAPWISFEAGCGAPDRADEVTPEEVAPDDRDSGSCYLVTEADVAGQVANGWLVPQRPGLDCNDEHIVGCAASGSCPVGSAAEVARITPLYVAQQTQTMHAWIEQNAPGISLEEAAQLVPWGICAPTQYEPQHLASAGVAIPGWLSSRIIGYGDGPDCN